MAYASTRDERSTGFFSSRATDYSDAPYSADTLYYLAPNLSNAGYGLLPARNGIADKDAYDLGFIFKGTITIRASGNYWFFGPGFVSYINPTVSLFDVSGTLLGGGFSSVVNVQLTSPGRYIVGVEGVAYESLQYQVSYTFTPIPNIKPSGNTLSISGNTVVGATVLIDGSFNDENGLAYANSIGGYSYKWYTLGSSGSKEVGSEAGYRIKPEDEGKDLYYSVAYTDDAGYIEVVSSGIRRVLSSNSPPISSNGFATTEEDKGLVGMLPAATDANGDAVSYAKATNPANGNVTVLPNGSYTYTPNADFYGADTFIFTVSDGRGGANAYMQTVTVMPVNDAPRLVAPIPDQSAGVGGAFSYTIPVKTFTDIDNLVLGYTVNLSNGSQLPNWLIFDAATRTFSGTPGLSDRADLSIRVIVSDGMLSVSDDFTLKVTAGQSLVSRVGEPKLTGGIGDDTLTGGAGNDLLDGGHGFDIAVYAGLARGHTLGFDKQGLKVIDKSGSAGIDALVNIEALQFSDRRVLIEAKPHDDFSDLPPSIYQFFILAFGAAPGVEYLQQCADAFRSGVNVRVITNVFTDKSQFTSTYPKFLTNSQLADRLIENVVLDSASVQSKAKAKQDITLALDAGLSRGDMIFTVFSNLSAKPLVGDEWSGTARLFQNQIAVARVYTEVMNQSTTDLETLRAAISAVTASSDVTSESSIVALVGQGLFGG